jgi:phosphatidylglycerophosphate synthase
MVPLSKRNSVRLYSIGPETVNGNGLMRRYRRLLSTPNLVTQVRPCSILPYLWLCMHRRWEALVLYGVVVASDMLDGWLARRLRQESALGRTLDHVCDVGFILVTLGYFVSQALIPWWLPAAIAWSFGLYCLDSWWRRDQQLRLLGSRLGHVGGVLYFGTVGLVTGLLVVEQAERFAPLMPAWYGCLTGVALLSGGQRLTTAWSLVKPAVSARQHRENIHQSNHSEP